MRDAVPDDEYAALVERHAQVVRSAIRRVLGPRHAELADDVEQELRLSLWKRLQGGTKIEHPVAYLYKAAMTTAWAVLKREPAARGALDVEQAVHDERRVEQRLRVAQILERLPEQQARAVRAYLAGFSHTEVAMLYGWTESVARHRIYRALDGMRRKYAGIGVP